MVTTIIEGTLINKPFILYKGRYEKEATLFINDGNGIIKVKAINKIANSCEIWLKKDSKIQVICTPDFIENSLHVLKLINLDK